MKAGPRDRARPEAKVRNLLEQLQALGAVQAILFGSLARGHISLFSDIDLLAILDQARPARELTRWVYENIRSREAVDILAYSREEFEHRRNRPFLCHILREGKVLYERHAA